MAASTPDNLQQSCAIRSSPDKGSIVVATVDIARGSLVLLETSRFHVPLLIDNDTMNKVVAKRVKELPKSDQINFLSLPKRFPGKNPFAQIFMSNLQITSPLPFKVGGLFLTFASINHSCLPNVHHYFAGSGVLAVRALRDIDAGEEITDCLSSLPSSSERRAWLKLHNGEECTCPVCSLPPGKLRQSDARRKEILLLYKAIDRKACGRMLSEPVQLLARCQKMVQLMFDEYRDAELPYVVQAYIAAFKICVVHSDQARASVLAQRWHDVIAIRHGTNDEEVREVKPYIRDPAKHAFFGMTKEWTSHKKLVPRSLCGQEFDQWVVEM